MSTFAQQPSNQDASASRTDAPGAAKKRSALDFLFASPDSNYRRALADYAAGEPRTIIGGTSIADPFQRTKHLFTKHLSHFAREDVDYAASISAPLTQATGREDMRLLVETCVGKLGCKPRLFLILLPFAANLHVDRFIGDLFEFAEDVPVFGGIVTDEDGGLSSAIFLNQEAHQDRIVLVGLAGSISPVFGVGYEITTPASYSPIITKASDNTVQMVDNITMADFLEKVGFDAQDLTQSIHDWPLSVWIRHPDSLPESAPRINTLVHILPDGSGVFSSRVPVGSAIRLAFLTRTNVANSAESAANALLTAMEEKTRQGYAFSQVLAVSSQSRYYVLSGGEQIEAAILAKWLPPGIATCGFYGQGEICPMNSDPGQLDARRHVQSLVLCAF